MQLVPIDIAASLMPPMPASTATFASTPSSILCATTRLIASDPQLEVELLNDVSHVALDGKVVCVIGSFTIICGRIMLFLLVSTFLNPNTAWLRLLNVIGRVVILVEDCIQDSPPDEWAFQVLMLVISTHLFLRSAWPLMLAVFTISELTVRDRRAYALFFEAVGLTVLQFKTLIASRAVEWIEYRPNEQVELTGDMYFLYAGEAGHDNSSITDSTLASPEGPRTLRIFGDVQFAKTLESRFPKNSKSDKKKRSEDSAVVAPSSNLLVGPNGATMIRISTSKLLQLMDNDNELSSSIQRLVLLCMQEKLSRTLHQNRTGLAQPSMSNATNAAPANI